jgi:hypothetical protein
MIELLFVAGVLDAVIPARRYRGLLRAGQFFTALGLLSVITSTVLDAVISFVVASLLLFLFALAAKLYGHLAIAATLLFFATCFALVAW